VINRHGLLVQRKDAWLATRRSGFDSPVVHSGTDRFDWKVAGYGWPGRTANAVSPRGMRVRIPCLPLKCPDGKEENHASVLTRSAGFESWSGHRYRMIHGPGGEMDDHASLLTRCSGFESWPGHRSLAIEVPWSSGEDVPLTWGRAVARVHPGSLVCVVSRAGRATRIGDGARLESG
jgi:hypothetical protein